MEEWDGRGESSVISGPEPCVLRDGASQGEGSPGSRQGSTTHVCSPCRSLAKCSFCPHRLPSKSPRKILPKLFTLHKAGPSPSPPLSADSNCVSCTLSEQR